MRFFLTTARGCEHLLADELATIVEDRAERRVGRGGVGFDGDLAEARRVALWTRIGDRLLERIDEIGAADGDVLYAAAGGIDWGRWIAPAETFAISVTVAGNAAIRDERWARHRLKDAIVDQLRERRGQRPAIDPKRPDVRVDLALHADRATVSVDLVGEPLHRRGLRGLRGGGRAPMRENVAAALLRRAGWDGAPRPFVDPMCGTGTFVLEAAGIALDRAPGWSRRSWWLTRHPDHDAAHWSALRDEAEARADAGRRRWEEAGAPSIVGFDADRDAVAHTLAAIERAELEGIVHCERRALSRVEAPAGTGLVVANPPWGKRLGDDTSLPDLYAALGRVLIERFSGWDAGIVTGEPGLGRALGLRADKRHDFRSGGTPIQLLRIAVGPEAVVRRDPARSGFGAGVEASEAPEDLVNRLRKNLKRWRKWARRKGDTDAFRVYDRDLPEFAVSVDSYADRPHVIEHVASADVDPELAKARLRAVVAAVSAVFDVEPSLIPVKRRRRQKAGAGYGRRESRGELLTVREGDARLLVNLWDFHDTGLFLDHRPMRRRIGAAAGGTRFLNLFGYTGTATVHAALGGARATTTVDLSAKYLDWARRNLAANGLAPDDHELVAADVMEWLADAPAKRWSLIFVDPPTVSKSKRMRGSFDVQRDHVELLRRVRRVATADATILFSTNFRKFKVDDAVGELFDVEAITDSIPEDFARSPNIHRAWELTRR